MYQWSDSLLLLEIWYKVSFEVFYKDLVPLPSFLPHQGVPGESGAKGEVGPRGADGRNGLDGRPGPKGRTGEKGSTGEEVRSLF